MQPNQNTPLLGAQAGVGITDNVKRAYRVATRQLTKDNAERAYRKTIHHLSRDIFFIDFLVARYPQLGHLKTFSNGASFVINKLWVPAFSTLLLHDAIEYWAYPSARYGTTFGEVLGGTAHNQLTYTSHLGSDLAGEWDYSLWPALMGGVVLAGGLGNMLYRRFHPARSTGYESISEDSEDPELHITESELHNQDLNLKQWAYAKISQPLKNLLGIYNTWTKGETVHPKWEAPFWLLLMYTLYADIRLLELWAIKIIGLDHYLKAKSECEKAHKMYTYLEDYGDYECSFCPDWSFVEPRDSFTSQGCLDGLLASGRTPDFILSHLDRILKIPDFKVFDFSRQPWMEWTESQWKELLARL